MPKRKIGRWVGFYLVTLLILGLLWGLFSPAASLLLRLGASTQGSGAAKLIPLSFLLLSFLYAFLRGRSEGRRGRWIAAYGWITGAAALDVLLLYFYLKQMTAGSL